MKVFHAPEAALHDPSFRISYGVPAQNAERPRRAELLLEAVTRLGLVPEAPPQAPRRLLEAVHSGELLTFLETAWQRWRDLPGAGPEVVGNVFPRVPFASYPDSLLGRAGWHMGDTAAPIGEHSWRAALRSVDCAVAAADAVLSGERTAYALARPPGHHTSRDVMAGHCMLNGSAIAAERLRERHDRVAVLDIDVHHGNGTQDIFYERADVLTVSVHADPHDYYPFFTGYGGETGHGPGEGFHRNLPLPRTTGDDAWCAAVADALETVAAYSPGALVVSLGLDAHENDPLAGMKVTFEGFRRAGALIASAGYPTALVQEGGYLSDDLSRSLEAYLAGAMT